MENISKETIEKTMAALRKNQMQAFYCETKEEVKAKVAELLQKGDTVTHGGSVTLAECDIPSLLRSGDYTYLDRSQEGLTREQVQEIYRKAFFSDVYLMSSNAVTTDGKLFNVDGNANRVAALMYGPKSVIVVVGINKIVENLDQAFDRLRTIAAPLNTKRLQCNTYCEKTGRCISLNNENSELGDGCFSEKRICCSYAVCSFQRVKDRIKVILVGEPLGY